MSANEGLTYRQSVWLVILGASVGFICSLGTTYVQTRHQREQMLMERRIAALRDFSASYYRLATDVLPRCERLRSLIHASKSALSQKNSDELLKNVTDTGVELDSYLQQSNAWTADMNTQIAVVNAVFHVNFKMFPFGRASHPLPAEKARSGDAATELESMESNLTNIEKDIAESLANGEGILASLAKRIEE